MFELRPLLSRRPIGVVAWVLGLLLFASAATAQGNHAPLSDGGAEDGDAGAEVGVAEDGDPEDGPEDGVAEDGDAEEAPFGTCGAGTAAEDGPMFGASGVYRRNEEPDSDLGRSVVTRAEMDERQPRSAPDALRYEPGVAIQQTAHGQASPYVRGQTGQQVVHLFDGIRMNNGLYRQGPNQYFFSVDQRSIARLEVLRGSSSVRFGSDALGGAILAHPLVPTIDPENTGLVWRPRLELRYGSADQEFGGRAQLELRLGRRTSLLLGGGYRDVGLLESGGVVRHRRSTGATDRGSIAPWVARFAEESEHPTDPSRWRTQLGTGFREATFDGRLEHQLTETLRLTGAVYGYRQMDAPRTDKCPSPEAPLDECLRIERQFRTLSYLALRGDAGPLRDLSLVLSHQRHSERRVRDRPRSFVRISWDDEVDTLGLSFRAASRPWVRRNWKATLRGGAEAYRDGVASRAEQRFTDLDREFELSRGQYLEGSRYINLGLWGELQLDWGEDWTFRSGLRGALVDVLAPPDPESGSRPVNRSFGAIVARAGVVYRPGNHWTITANVDQGFRAPNLDDLTSRQQTGPGFQFENPDLQPEGTWTTELGLRGQYDAVSVEAWAYATFISDSISRVVREADDCPPNTMECRASRDQFQLINASEGSRIFGAEGALTLRLPGDLRLRGTVSYAWGEGPSLGDRRSTPAGTRVPLSRIPPLQGTLEGRWRHRRTGIWLGAALRWSAAQTRLAISDQSDARVPDGGTPEFAVLDLRVGWRFGRLMLGGAFENVFDAAYRVHGSSVNGAGRSVTLWSRLGF